MVGDDLGRAGQDQVNEPEVRQYYSIPHGDLNGVVGRR